MSLHPHPPLPDVAPPFGAGFGVIVLCHAPLGRAAQVIAHWARHGVPVAVHVDAATPEAEMRALQATLAGLAGIIFVPRLRSPWGRWGLVEASLRAAQALMDRWPDLGHVLLTSGACLPIRPVGALAAHLAAHPDTDFIEAVALGSRRWTMGGLEAERFALHFPVSRQRNRRVFDALVRLQLALGVRRAMPAGLRPHLGLQWWCLTQATLRAILTDPEGPSLRRYFRGVWIPDESFFQTMAARHARVIAPPLTFQRFDTRGTPHILYDDHQHKLAACPAFVARKVWPGAEGLYRAFLDDPEGTRAATTEAPDALDRAIEAAHRLRREGRVGLRAMGRLPDPALGLPTTAAPHGIFWGLEAMMPGFHAWLSVLIAGQPADLHGRLFAPEGAVFAGGAAVGPGALSPEAALRDYAPVDFVSNLVWATRGRVQLYLADAGDGARLAAAVAGDCHARGLVVTGTGADATARMAEAAGLAALGAPDARHGLTIIAPEDFRADPAAALRPVLLGLIPALEHAAWPPLPPLAAPSAPGVS